MRFVLKENVAQEVKGTHQLSIKPEIFLELTTPKADWQQLKRFISAYKKNNTAVVDEMYNAADVDQIGGSLIKRAIDMLKKHAGFKPEMASKDAFSLVIAGYPTAHVVNHSGRARSLMAALTGQKVVTCTLSLYGKTAEEILTDKATNYIAGQKFMKDPVNYVERDLVLGGITK